ncbi:DUF3604 domain-containing protein [Clostridiales bacterium COT073_COT-073]|nr:DUF3604 domain-containing protein [Clostridiales bacterium COT073_COT-073]
MKESTITNNYGTFTVEIPETVTVDGEIGWHIKFALSTPVAKGGGIRIVFPAYTHQRSIEYVQNIDYWKPHFIYAYFEEENAGLKTRVEKIDSEFTHILRWPDSDRIAVITAQEDWPAGAVLHIFYGGIDRMWLKGRVCPTRAPHHATFADGTFLQYEFSIDGQGNGEYKKLDIIPSVRVNPDEALYLSVAAPTAVRPGQKFKISYTVGDRFHNPIWKYTDQPQFILRNLKTGQETQILNEDGLIEEEGYYEVDCRNLKLKTEKAVICCQADAQPIYWGDTHCHTVLTPNIHDNNNGACPQDAYNYAQKVSNLDFVCLVEQTFIFDDNAKQNITPQLWEKIREISNQNYTPGQFVTFPGFELHSQRGDTVVFFAEDMSNFQYPAEVVDIYDVWRLYQGKDYMTVPHFHRYCGGRLIKDQQEQQHSGFDLKNWEPADDAERLCEFYSAQWGRFEYPGNPMLLKAMSNIPENDVNSFLNRGKIWGMTAGSDDHDSMPGHGGLTAVYADALTREGVFKGLKNRQTYATTHTRMYLNYQLAERPIGESLMASQAKAGDALVLKAAMAAPVNIRSVDLIVNGQVFQKIAVNERWLETELTVPAEMMSAGSYLYVRVKLADENIVVGSPIWVK